jgi:hypothetical protein
MRSFPSLIFIILSCILNESQKEANKSGFYLFNQCFRGF